MSSAEMAMLEGRFDCDLGVEHFFAGGVYARKMEIPQGFRAGSHAHKYAHLSILARGVVRLTRDGGESYILRAPACISMLADTYHTVEAIESSIWYCVHATDERDVSKIDEVLIVRS